MCGNNSYIHNWITIACRRLDEAREITNHHYIIAEPDTILFETWEENRTMHGRRTSNHEYWEKRTVTV
jgi:hypothetical protein